MTENEILDNTSIRKNKVNWRHFGLFYLIQVIITFIAYYLARKADPGTIEMFYSNLFGVLEPLLLLSIMIATHRSTEKLKFREKILPLAGLLSIHYISVVTLNGLNVFDRAIDEQGMIDGVIRTGIFEIVMFILCLPLIAIVRSKRQLYPI